MALPPINPTQITPPRVALIDERSGAISREWYRFFLSLRNATESTQSDVELSPDTGSLLATYDALLETLAQDVQTPPEGASVADVAVVQSDIQALELAPPSASASELAAMQAEIFGLGLAPRAELGTIASKNKGASGSFVAGAVTVTVVDGIITSIV